MLSEFERRVRELEEMIRLLAWERVYIVDADGSVAFSGDGGEHFAYVPDPIARRRLVLHNHPSGESFSRRDVETLLRVHATEFRLITRHHRFRLAPPSGPPWHELEGFVNVIHYDEMEALADQIRSQSLTPDEAGRQLLHRVWVRVAASLGWDYRREEIDR